MTSVVIILLQSMDLAASASSAEAGKTNYKRFSSCLPQSLQPVFADVER